MVFLNAGRIGQPKERWGRLVKDESECASVKWLPHACPRARHLEGKTFIWIYTGIFTGETTYRFARLFQFQAEPSVVEKAVIWALEVGYRLIDTAYNYGNEEAIGKAVNKWIENGGRREDLFITTKVNTEADQKRTVILWIILHCVHIGRISVTACPLQ